VRGGGGTLSASIRRRWIGCFDRPPHAAPHRRSEGAPASPLRYSAPRAGGAASPACVSRTRLRMRTAAAGWPAILTGRRRYLRGLRTLAGAWGW